MEDQNFVKIGSVGRERTVLSKTKRLAPKTFLLLCIHHCSSAKCKCSAAAGHSLNISRFLSANAGCCTAFHDCSSANGRCWTAIHDCCPENPNPVLLSRGLCDKRQMLYSIRDCSPA